jgi:hypothetical protein
MAQERTLGLARAAADEGPDDHSKAELQRRLEETRGSISHTVTEIKDTVVHQYETVKETISDTLDWREHFKKRPVVWSVGAVGGGLALGYAIAALAKGNSTATRLDNSGYSEQSYAAAIPVNVSRSSLNEITAPVSEKREDTENKPGLFERFQETAAYDRLRMEAATVGNRFVSEISQTAQDVVLPAAISWLRQWLDGVTGGAAANKANKDRPAARHAVD